MLKIKADLTAKSNASTTNPENANTPFVQVLLEVIEDQQIGPGAFRLYTLLIAISRGFGACWPSQPTLASRLGVSQRTIRNWLKELETAKLIEIEHRYTAPGQEQSNLYRLKKLVPRQGERGRQEDIIPPGKGLPPPLENSCHIQRKKISAYIHEEELHDKKDINTHGAGRLRQDDQSEHGVCAATAEDKSSVEETEQVANPREQPQTDPDELALILIEQQLKQAGVSTARIKKIARLVVQNGRTARYVEEWLSWISRHAYIQNPAAYLLSRIQENTDVPRPRVQSTPLRSASPSWTVNTTYSSAALGPATSSTVSDEEVAPVTMTEGVQPELACAKGMLHLVVDNTMSGSSVRYAHEDEPELRLVVDNTLPPDDLLALEVVSSADVVSQPTGADSIRAAKPAPVSLSPDITPVNTTNPSPPATTADKSSTTVDIRLKELIVQRDPRIRRVKRLEVVGETLYVAFWSKVDREAGVGPSWLADVRFFYPEVRTIVLL